MIKHNMPDAEYFAADAASNSTLSRMVKSPAHCKAYLESDKTQTPSMLLGSVFHCLTLEPDLYDSRYAVAPNIDRRTKAGKEEYSAFCDASEGKTVITADVLEKASAMRDSVLSKKKARALLSEGDAEVSIFWKDQDVDYPCKARIDFVSSRGVLVDLKSTKDAGADFKRSIVNYGYHRQDAFYSDGYKAHTGESLPFMFIAVEPEPPYACAMYMIDDAGREKGRNEYKSLLKQFAECKRTDIWPAYSEDIEIIELPAWYK